ncbi:MAG: glycosyltransferase family 39 protein [Dehalococcoidia bacterium]|nr:glycosyltransferase family 39 protein [Dehalococcoidia bacterium]
MSQPVLRPAASRVSALSARKRAFADALLDLLSSRQALLLAGVFALAFLVRLVFIVLVDPDPQAGIPDDSLFYDSTASWLAEGRGYIHLHGEPTAHWPPGYSMILAVIYKLLGHHVFLGKMLNVFAGAATSIAVYFLGAKVFDRRVGLLGALLLAFFPSQVFGATLLMTEVIWGLAVTLLLLLVIGLTIERPTLGRVALTGLVIGILSMIRGETVLLALALVPVWAVAQESWPAGLRFGAVALAATGVALLPWTVRNWVQLGYPIVVSAGSAENLIAGHWEGADGLGNFVPVIAVQKEYEDVRPPEREVKVYREQTRRAIEYALNHPADELRLIPQKLFHFYRDDSRPLLWIQAKGDLLSAASEARLRDLANTYYLAVLAAAVAGAPLWLRRVDPKRLLLIMLVAYYSFLFGFVFIGEPRFHSALIPVFCILAAVFFVRAGERVWDRLKSGSKTGPGGAGESGAD